MKSMNSWAAVSLLSALLASVFSGCWTSDNKSPEIPASPASPKVEPPVVNQTLDQVRQEMNQYDRFSPQFDQGRLKMAVLQDEARKKHGVEGFEQHESQPIAVYSSPTAVVDEKTRRIAWRAMTCCNPKCTAQGRGGGPYLFTLEFSWITVGPDGKINIGPPNAEEMNRPFYCPVCKSKDFIRAYDTPETAARQIALTDELKRSYQAYAEAAKTGGANPAGVRSPDAVAKEIEALPKVYLLSEPGKVQQFDAVTAPVGSGTSVGAR